MEIPMEKLSKQALYGLIEAFVQQDGTDYGEQAYSIDEKVRQVKKQLAQKKAIIVFDQETESCWIQPNPPPKKKKESALGEIEED